MILCACKSPAVPGFILHLYRALLFFFPRLVLLHTNVYSFHHGVLFVPPRWKEKNSTVERNFSNGETNKLLLLRSLTAARKRDKNSKIGMTCLLVNMNPLNWKLKCDFCTISAEIAF